MLFNFRIRGRLYGGFGALILFCAALAGFGVWQLWATQESVGSMTIQSNNTIRAVQISSELQAIRRGILRYNFDHDEASFAEAEKRLGDISVLLDGAIRETRSEERRALYRDIRTDISELKQKRVDLGTAIKQMQAGKALLLTNGDQLVADVKKFVDAAENTEFSVAAGGLEAKLLLVQAANWRFLATRDPKGLATFNASVDKATQDIAALEDGGLPPSLGTRLAPIKADLVKYADAFGNTSTSVLLGDAMYSRSITPLAIRAIEKTDAVKTSMEQAFAKTITDTHDRITATVTLQEVVAGHAIERVVAVATVEIVVAAVAGENVGDGGAVQGVAVAAGALDVFDVEQPVAGGLAIVAVAAGQVDIHAGRTVVVDGVDAVATIQPVGAVATLQEVVAVEAIQRIVAVIAIHVVGERRSEKQVVAAVAIEISHLNLL